MCERRAGTGCEWMKKQNRKWNCAKVWNRNNPLNLLLPLLLHYEKNSTRRKAICTYVRTYLQLCLQSSTEQDRTVTGQDGILRDCDSTNYVHRPPACWTYSSSNSRWACLRICIYGLWTMRRAAQGFMAVHCKYWLAFWNRVVQVQYFVRVELSARCEHYSRANHSVRCGGVEPYIRTEVTESNRGSCHPTRTERKDQALSRAVTTLNRDFG